LRIPAAAIESLLATTLGRLGLSSAAREDSADLRSLIRRVEIGSDQVVSVEALATKFKQERKHVNGILNLAFLAPDLTKAILNGEQPPGLRLAHLLAVDLPVSWKEQRALFR
jgi:hypothetical protein